MNEAINVEVTDKRENQYEKREIRDEESLESFEGLSQNAADDFLFHAARPAVAHNVSSTAFVHQTKSDAESVTSHPRTPDAQDIGML